MEKHTSSVLVFPNGTFNLDAPPELFETRPDIKAYVVLWGLKNSTIGWWSHPIERPIETWNLPHLQTDIALQGGLNRLKEIQRSGRGLFYDSATMPSAADPMTTPYMPWLGLTGLSQMTTAMVGRFVDEMMGVKYSDMDFQVIISMTDHLVPGNVVVPLSGRDDLAQLPPGDDLFPFMIRALYSRYNHPVWVLARYLGMENLGRDEVLDIVSTERARDLPNVHELLRTYAMGDWI